MGEWIRIHAASITLSLGTRFESPCGVKIHWPNDTITTLGKSGENLRLGAEEAEILLSQPKDGHACAIGSRASATDPG